LGALEGGGELEAVRRDHPVVGVGGVDKGRRIGGSLVRLVIGRVGVEGAELLRHLD